MRIFPEGFSGASYAKDERNYKLAAKAKLDATAPLLEARDHGGFGEAILRAFSTNLLSPFEKMRVRDVLASRDADRFVKAAATFTAETTKASLTALTSTLQPYDCAKWTVVTYLPFLWAPETHMFLKPEVTKDFAARVGHRFAVDYEAALEFDVYLSLLYLAATTDREIAALQPKDRIDTQSFIWTVGAYPEPDV